MAGVVAILRFLTSIWLLSNRGSSQIFTPTVQTSQGRLRGLYYSSGSFGVNRYYGIPYATSQRFQPPREPPPFKGMFNAVRRFETCAQTVSIFTSVTEDCQRLDVHTPAASNATRLPVMVFLHGGAYYYGTKDIFNSDFLVTKNVIAVVINYRVSVLGFLCLHDVANLGLKDQVAALKWVRKNIAAFGGDPDNVTLYGQSAGAAAVGMHLLSRQSKGLFHKAIMASGSPLAPWAFNVEPTVPAFDDVSKMANVDTINDIYEILADYPVRDILSATEGRSDNSRYFKYSPCVDSNLTDPFFHDTPYNIITSGDFNKVPVIIGVTELEGLLFYGINNDRTLKDWDENFVERLPSLFSWCSEKDRKIIAKMIRKYYFGSKRVDRSTARNIITFYSDWMADATVDAFSQLLTEHSGKDVYNYLFAYVGDRSFFSNFFGGAAGVRGATHVDDLFYVFKVLNWMPPLSRADQRVIDGYTTMLTNFMKFGKPTVGTRELPDWLPSTATRSRTLRIDRKFSVTSRPWPRPGFLLRMLCTYGQQGYAPCESAQQCNRD